MGRVQFYFEVFYNLATRLKASTARHADALITTCGPAPRHREDEESFEPTVEGIDKTPPAPPKSRRP